MSFEQLGLAPALLSAIQSAGFTQPTPVQSKAIPFAIDGKDLLVSSQTGSGKTAAFMLPALHQQVLHCATKPKAAPIRILVLTPTRELALQVAEATELYAKNLPWLKVTTVVGGMPYGPQIKALSKRVDVLVATPGRLIDHLNAGRVNLSQVRTLVLDEADRMLDMGFIEDIEAIVQETPENRQTLLFSATFEDSIKRLAERMLNQPERIEIASQKEKHENIAQSLYFADDKKHKLQLLDHLLRDAAVGQAIIFTATKRGADDLANTLYDSGFSSAALHGDMNQRQRTRTLGLLQKGRVKVLVATDVAARGIDVQGISHVVNFDLPMQAEDYVHRIGRTGRAGRDGIAYTLVEHAERYRLRGIERYISQEIQISTVSGLEPKKSFEQGKAKKGGKKPSSRGGRPNSRGGYSDRPRFDREGSSERSASKESRFARSEGSKPSYRSEGSRSEGTRTGYRSEGSRSEGAKPGYRSEGRSSEGRSFSERRNTEGRSSDFAGRKRSFGDNNASGSEKRGYGQNAGGGQREQRRSSEGQGRYSAAPSNSAAPGKRFNARQRTSHANS